MKLRSLILLSTLVASFAFGSVGCSQDTEAAEQASDVTEGSAAVHVLLSDFPAQDPSGRVATWDVTVTSAKLKTIITMIGKDASGKPEVELITLRDPEASLTPGEKVEQNALVLSRDGKSEYASAILKSESARVSAHLQAIIDAQSNSASTLSTQANKVVLPCVTLIELMIAVGGLGTWVAAAAGTNIAAVGLAGTVAALGGAVPVLIVSAILLAPAVYVVASSGRECKTVVATPAK
jgi:hypothetical protein